MRDERTDTEATNDRLGALEQTGSGWELRFVRLLSKPPSTVWRAFADPALLARWFPDSVVGDLVAGASLRFDVRDFEAESFGGTVLEVDEPRLLAMTWGTDVLRFELAEAEGGTRLTMIVVLGEYGRAARDGAGWHECLDRLVALWPGNRGRRGGDVGLDHPAYVERFGPEAAAIGPPQEYLDRPGG